METYENALPMQSQGEGASEPASFPSKDESFDRRVTIAFAGDHSRLGTESFAAKCRELDDRSVGYRFFKRLFDIVFSLVVVGLGILLLPVTLIVLIATAVSTKGFPIYVQKRVGRYGKPLHILKLRSMVADSDDVEKYLTSEQLVQWKRERKVDNDPRITRFGAFCRKTSLAPVIIGTPGDGEPTKSLSYPENSSLDLQKCERRPGTSLSAHHHYTSLQFLSFTVFGGPEGTSGWSLCAFAQVPFASVGTAA